MNCRATFNHSSGMIGRQTFAEASSSSMRLLFLALMLERKIRSMALPSWHTYG
jgi:hypothetical protein